MEVWGEGEKEGEGGRGGSSRAQAGNSGIGNLPKMLAKPSSAGGVSGTGIRAFECVPESPASQLWLSLARTKGSESVGACNYWDGLALALEARARFEEESLVVILGLL